jgi:shikimate kinase
MKPIILIGFMGVGKTSLGKKLAKKLGCNFIDSDKWIEKKTGKSIPEIFQTEGEAYFRELEKICVNELKEIKNTVVSVGGGLPCFNDTMKDLNVIGSTVYLKLEPKELVRRLSESKIERPLLQGLTGDDLESFIEGKLLLREVFYSQAHFTIRPDRDFLDNCFKLFSY